LPGLWTYLFTGYNLKTTGKIKNIIYKNQGKNKMKSKTILIIIGSVIFLLTPADIFGQDRYLIAGNDLVEDMRASEKVLPDIFNDGITSDNSNRKYVPGASFYRGYIIGILDATSNDYNLPEKATGDQLIAVVTKYLKENPAQWDLPASFLVHFALNSAFGLSESGGKKYDSIEEK